MMRFIMIVLVIVAGLLIHRDKKRSLDRAEKWEFESRAGAQYLISGHRIWQVRICVVLCLRI